MLERKHQNFLGKFFKEGTHYTKDEAPIGFLKHEKQIRANHINELLDHENSSVRYAAIQHPKANNSENISKALHDSDWTVRNSALRHPDITKEHLDTALNDGDELVRRTAARHPNYRKYFPNGHQ